MTETTVDVTVVRVRGAVRFAVSAADSHPVDAGPVTDAVIDRAREDYDIDAFAVGDHVARYTVDDSGTIEEVSSTDTN